MRAIPRGPGIERIAAGIDGGPAACDTAYLASCIAGVTGAELTVVVVDTKPWVSILPEGTGALCASEPTLSCAS